MPEYKACSVWISIDDAVANEYATRTLEETNKVECWVASDVGKAFRIHFKSTQVNGRSPISLAAKVFLDGVFVGMRFLDGFLSTIHVSATEVRDIVFSPLTLTDNDEHRDNPVNGSYGEICVEIWEVVDSGTTTAPPIPIMPSQVVHETSKKAGVHCVGLGQPRRSQAICRLVEMQRRVTMFTFYYKPLAVLQAHEIAPRPPPRSPSPLRDPSPPRCSPPLDDEGASNDEYNRLQAQVQELQARMDAISKGKRPAPNAEAGPSAKRVKREPNVVPVSLRGEVIDLTMDD
ncbi:hypothetical protein ONZ45_g8239 [Pleurotus djamor]|nr:hypothetical protein ONZ45_g8239 [Pleurotus djamor]